LISGILAGLNCGWFARGPGCGKRRLACRAAHRHVLADDLAKGQQAQGEEQQDEGDDGPFDHGLSRLPALHGDDPGSKRSIVCTHCAAIGNLVNGGTGTGRIAGAVPRMDIVTSDDLRVVTLIGAAEGSSFCHRSTAARVPSFRVWPASAAWNAPSRHARARLFR